jgi:catechol 2,3-dioxygenase-like lactoylglutathione lyase family enzyme
MRRQLKTTRVLGALAVAALAFGVVASPRVSAEPNFPRKSGAPLITAVARVEVVVRDLARSRAFFEALGFSASAEEQLVGVAAAQHPGIAGARVRRLPLTLGSEHFTLLQYVSAPGRAVPADTRGNDLWFQHIAIVVSDMDRAFDWLRAHGVAYVSSAPQTLPEWNHAAAGIQAFYFADPDGHALELIHFPKGKGDPRWQTPPSCQRAPAELCLFLGIDHTAITVSNTEQSLRFYRDQLGLSVAGESENYGPEQEHLNGVFGARLRITALRAARGPGIELLEYLAPRGGRALARDARANDLWQWQVVVSAGDSEALADGARSAGGRVVSHTNPAREVLVRDSDGHALLAHESP